MIPEKEQDLLLFGVARAVDWAERGEVARGRASLLLGLSRANHLAGIGADYGEQLILLWTVALERFTERFGEANAAEWES